MSKKCLMLQKTANQINLSDIKEVCKCICYSTKQNYIIKVNMHINKKNMIESQLKPEGISCLNTIGCLSEINREDFVPSDFINMAYAEYDIPLQNNFTMLRPLLVAKILQLLEIKKSDNILEVGTGSGYLTCCLSLMANSVDTLDIDINMLENSKKSHKKYNLHNINYFNKDIFSSWTSNKKYDAVILTGSIDSRIDELENLLCDNGKMFAVIGSYPVMHANVIKRVSKDKFLCDQTFETTLDPLRNIYKKNSLNF